MKTSAMILGIVGGIIALLIGLLLFTLVQFADTLGNSGGGVTQFLGIEIPINGGAVILIQVLSIVIPTIGIVGAAIVRNKTLIGGVLMLLSAFGMVGIFRINILSLLPGVLLFIAGTLALASEKYGRYDAAPPISESDAPVGPASSEVNIDSQLTTCTNNINCPGCGKTIYSGEQAFKCRSCGAFYHPSCARQHLRTSNNCLICGRLLT